MFSEPTPLPMIEFATQPMNVTVNESMMATFQCAISSPSPASVAIQWWFTSPRSQQRQLVADQQGSRVAGYSIVQGNAGNLTLVVQNVHSTQNQAMYTCRVQSPSMTREASAILLVLCKIT